MWFRDQAWRVGRAAGSFSVDYEDELYRINKVVQALSLHGMLSRDCPISITYR